MAPAKNNPNGIVGRRPHLKSRNAAYLWSFVGVNLALFLSVFITKGFSSSSIDQVWKGVTTRNGIIATCIPLLTIVLSGMFGDQTKARLVFWRWRNPLPGSRVFTELIGNDTRIDISALRKKHGEFPSDAKEQNALWYRLYKKHTGNVIVTEAHRNYLLTRDMTALSAIFLVLFSVAISLDSVSWKVGCIYIISLIGQYLIIASSAQNYGTRFVLNVLTEESHTRQGPFAKASRRETRTESDAAQTHE
jgi:hypothetical protein